MDDCKIVILPARLSAMMEEFLGAEKVEGGLLNPWLRMKSSLGWS